MLAIIQERLKKINSQISAEILASFSVTLIILIIFSVYIYKNEKGLPISYTEQATNTNNHTNNTSKIFASKNGKTYTFSWCQGSNKIKEENKIYFKNEQEALNSGRVLSKLCIKNN